MEHTVISIVLIILALVGSNVLSQLFPKFSLQLIQIIFGVLIALFVKEVTFELESELFLSLVIAPLLFREGEESDITSVLKHWKVVAYLIFVVLIVSTIFMGVVAQALIPETLPLAACFILGASLGPTDAVAFSSLEKSFQFPKYIKSILNGEGLLNDASGLVSFQVSLLALMTGAFSLWNASLSLIWSIIAGFIVGLLIAGLYRLAMSVLNQVDISDVITSLLLELAMPLSSYFLAEEVGGSGIIAVVVAGVMQASRFKKVTLLDARIDSVTDIVWRTITFLLNGLVFILLGTELVHLSQPILMNPAYNNWLLFWAIIILTISLFFIRFVLLYLYYAFRNRKTSHRTWYHVKDILILTFSGVKGTVSIATVLLVPEEIAQEYGVVLFTVAGVTLLSFITGLIILPRLTKEKEEVTNHLIEIAILTEVIQTLQDELENVTHPLAHYAAIDNVQNRLEELILDQEGNELKSELVELQMMMIRIEADGMENAFKRGDISIQAYRVYQDYIRYLENTINRNVISATRHALLIVFRIAHRFLREFVNLKTTVKGIQQVQGTNLTAHDNESLEWLYFTNTQIILESLEHMEGVYDTTLINFLQDSRLRQAEILTSGRFVERVLTRVRPHNNEALLRAYQIERDSIHRYEKSHELTPRQAKLLRQNVNSLENYSLKEKSNTLPYDLLNYRRNMG